MVLASTGGSTGSDAGGTGIGLSPTQQKSQSDLSNSVKRVAGQTSGGGGGTYQPGQGVLLPGISTLSGSAKDPSIYIGPSATASALGLGGISEAGAYAPQSQVQQMYYQWDPKTKNKFLSQLSLAGYDTTTLKDAQLASLWAGYVEVAGKYNVAGTKMSPWDVIAKDIAQHTVAAAAPKTVTQTSTRYNISTAEDAHALFESAAQTLLGRNPTKSEISRFKTVLNKYEAANPAVITQTSKYLGSDLQSRTSTTTGGVTAAGQQLAAEEEAKKNPEYGAYQAATNGMNWLMEMVNGG